MPRVMRSDGSWETLSKDEYIERYGEEEYRELTAPVVPISDLPPGRRGLAKRMQSEQDVSTAFWRAGKMMQAEYDAEMAARREQRSSDKPSA